VSLISIIALIIVIAPFPIFAIGLFSAQLYTNSKGDGRKGVKAAVPSPEAEDRDEFRHAA